MPYPLMLGGDHAEFEAKWAASGRPDHERPDWPLPSFDAKDWAKAFCETLMRGYDQRASELPPTDEEQPSG
jgi:hypothetical protein